MDHDIFAKLSFEIFGLKPPRDEEIKRAQEILADAPSGSPLEVAEYFAGLSDKGKDDEGRSYMNAEGESYNAEWESRANPVIVAFFEATNFGRPEGDQTKWCAAFVNWCLNRAGKQFTNSASSGSFRCFGDAADNPQPGDIAVFKNRGQDEPCSGSGHVAFYLSRGGDFVEVLGGNQGNRVRVSRYPASEANAGNSPWLVTIRKSP